MVAASVAPAPSAKKGVVPEDTSVAADNDAAKIRNAKLAMRNKFLPSSSTKHFTSTVVSLVDKAHYDRAVFGEQVVDNKYCAQSSTDKPHIEHMPWGIISPKNTGKTIWDVLQAFVLIFLAINVPVQVGFSEFAVGGSYVFSLLIDLYFWVDIFLNLFFFGKNLALCC